MVKILTIFACSYAAVALFQSPWADARSEEELRARYERLRIERQEKMEAQVRKELEPRDDGTRYIHAPTGGLRGWSQPDPVGTIHLYDNAGHWQGTVK